MTMPIDVRQVDWLYVAILALFALVANLIANLLFFRRRGVADLNHNEVCSHCPPAASRRRGPLGGPRSFRLEDKL